MNRLRIKLLAVSLFAVVAGSSCTYGLRKYPGHPAVVTDGFSKLDYEELTEDGLFIYEASYDNRPGGPGPTSAVTKLYPNAKTFTSNVRTNAHGSNYYTKEEYKGAVVQMIYLPQTNEVILPSDTKVTMFLDQDLSMNEFDRINTSEVGLFSTARQVWTALTNSGRFQVNTKFKLLRAGRLDSNGSLNYTVAELDLDGKVFKPSSPVQIQTNFAQTGVRTNITGKIQSEFVTFLETNYPRGFSGTAKIKVTGSADVIEYPVKLNTPKTLAGTSTKLYLNQSPAQVEQWLKKIRNRFN